MKRLAFVFSGVLLLASVLVVMARIDFPIDSTYFDVPGDENEWLLANNSGTASKDRDTSVYFAGTGSLRLVSSTTGANDYADRQLDATPSDGEIFTIGGYINVSGFSGPAFGSIGLAIFCYYNSSTAAVINISPITGNTDGWEYREAQVTCPENANNVVGYLYIPNATVYYDELIWGTSSEVNTPTPTPTNTPTNTPTPTPTSTPLPPTVTPGADFYQVDLPSGGTGVVEMKTTAGEIFITAALLLVFSVGLFGLAKDLAHTASKK